MPKKEIFNLRPLGWETDPAEERSKISTLDYLCACTYTHYCLFFKLDDDEKPKAIEILKAGLERTLSQARHLCGTIEKDAAGGHSFVKKRDTTVEFRVQWLDAPEDNYPSLGDLEKANFCGTSLGDLNLWSIPPMTYGEKAEAHPDVSPVISAFMVNLIRGGLVFIMHAHHYANDVMGWSGFTHQLAENCNAILNNVPFPEWDPSCLDVSRLIKVEPPEEKKIDGPPQPDRHPDHTVSSSYLFHLPKRKAAELKRLARPTDGTWISTYDAFSAFIWRTFTRLRAPIFKPDLSQPMFWSEAVDMRRRMHSPKVAPRIQHNVMFAVLSPSAPVTQPTAAEVISEWSLPQLASYIRKLTNSCTQEGLDEALGVIATIRDKSAMSIRINSYPPLSLLQTDHRDANITAADFGFGKPLLYRHPLDCVTEGLIVVYPPRAGGEDEGPEFTIAYEKALAQTLIDDPEWSKYFEYRGIDAEDTVNLPN